MADRPEPYVDDATQVQALNFGDAFGRPAQTVPQELLDAQTGASNAESSLPGMLSSKYSDMWKERPTLACATTIGATTAGSIAIWKMPRMSSNMGGAYGLTKLVVSDAPDLYNAKGLADASKYGVACTADLTMVAGMAARYIPRVRDASRVLTAVGVGGRLFAEVLPETVREAQPIKPEFLESVPTSKKYPIDVSLKSGQTDHRSYNAFIPSGKDKPLPVVIMLPGVENNSAPGAEAETGLNRLARQKDFIAVYPHAKERDQPMLGKIRDWNSEGAGLTITDSYYDDVDYIKGIVDQIQASANVDRNAIYVVGFSSGGAFAQHLRGRLPGTFAGVGSIHGTLLGTEAKAQDKSAFVSVHSDSDQMLPYAGGRGLMTSLLPRVAESKPQLQITEALRINGLSGEQPKIASYNGIRVTEYSGASAPPVKEYFVEGGLRGGMLGGIVGRGRDGFPAVHAIDGTGAGGWPIVGDKNKAFDSTKLVVEELLKYKKH